MFTICEYPRHSMSIVEQFKILSPRYTHPVVLVVPLIFCQESGAESEPTPASLRHPSWPTCADSFLSFNPPHHFRYLLILLFHGCRWCVLSYIAGRPLRPFAMAPTIPSAKLTLSCPLFAADFDPRNHGFLLVGGGGGEGRSGVGNKIAGSPIFYY
jgi:hypothetical protein